jgi:hypothetical protein
VRFFAILLFSKPFEERTIILLSSMALPVDRDCQTRLSIRQNIVALSAGEVLTGSIIFGIYVLTFCKGETP